MLLAGGVSQALISTELGLSVGLVAMLGYALFRIRVQQLVTYFEAELAGLSVKVLSRLASRK
jgi:biopolymer transport protein ExbB